MYNAWSLSTDIYKYLLNSAKWWRKTYSAVPQEGKQTERQESGTLSKQIKWPLHCWTHSLISPSKLFVLVKHFGVLKFSKIFFKCFELCINDRIFLLLLSLSLLDQILWLRKELQYFLLLKGNMNTMVEILYPPNYRVFTIITHVQVLLFLWPSSWLTSVFSSEEIEQTLGVWGRKFL